MILAETFRRIYQIPNQGELLKYMFPLKNRNTSIQNKNLNLWKLTPITFIVLPEKRSGIISLNS